MTYTWHLVGLSSQWMGECHSWPHSDSRRCPWWCVGVCYHECDQYCSCYLGLSFPSCSTGPVKLCWPAACWREMVWPPALRQVTVGRGSPADGQVQTSTFTQYMVLRVCFGHSLPDHTSLLCVILTLARCNELILNCWPLTWQKMEVVSPALLSSRLSLVLVKEGAVTTFRITSCNVMFLKGSDIQLQSNIIDSGCIV